VVSTEHSDGAKAERLAGAVAAALPAFGNRAAAKDQRESTGDLPTKN
jgi:hypothetical protein